MQPFMIPRCVGSGSTEHPCSTRSQKDASAFGRDQLQCSHLSEQTVGSGSIRLDQQRFKGRAAFLMRPFQCR
eukprot:12430292-Karenia_brevis.AAC.1